MGDLPDINVWIALSMADHPHHERARHYWYEESADSLHFCRVTALGYLRLLTNSTVMGGNPFTVPQAWQAYGAFLRLPEVTLKSESESCEVELGAWATQNEPSPRRWTDAYLAAFARTSGLRLVSFDRDCTLFQHIDSHRLEVP